MIREIKGDIFESDADILACPVNLVGAMGAGLAYAFRDKHPDLYYHYKKICRQRRWRDGALSVYHPTDAKYRVLLFPTKVAWQNDSDVQLIRTTLLQMRRLHEHLPFGKIALPRLGGGKGNLDFDKEVLPMIYEILNDVPYDIDIYV